jgi:hypothetical protein
MRRKRICPQILLSIALVFSLIFPTSVIAQGKVTPLIAAGYFHTVGLKSDGTIITTGFKVAKPTEWNLKLTKTINWPLIGVIIAAVVAVELVILFVHTRRTA